MGDFQFLVPAQQQDRTGKKCLKAGTAGPHRQVAFEPESSNAVCGAMSTWQTTKSTEVRKGSLGSEILCRSVYLYVQDIRVPYIDTHDRLRSGCGSVTTIPRQVI